MPGGNRVTRKWTLPLVTTAFLCGSLAALPVIADTVLITGANSGLGLEFARQYARQDWTVIATHRRSSVPESLAALMAEHPRVRVERMDVSSIDEVKALAVKLKGVPIDVLINNAGIYSDRSECATETCRGAADTQTFGNLDYALLDNVMAVNLRGPLVVSENFVDNIRASTQKKIISISSTNGSVSQPLGGSGAIAYRSSKAALNRAMQLVAVHLKDEGIVVLMLHPGAVLTERQADLTFPGMIEMPPSVTGMIEQIAKATIKDTGRFIQYDGTTAPW
jgi:NAD(P)-dependent dehydrogenase (short-subunit alcohol dehydrogenase family)